MNNQHNNWLNFLLLTTLWATSSPLLAQSESGGQMCADVITYGKNPQTGEWQTFPTPCEVPKGWQSSPVKPNPSVRADEPASIDTKVCEQVITYGKDPQTGKWVEYPRPCDVPDGWEKSLTKPADMGTSGSVTPSGETSGSSNNTTSENQDDCAKEEIIYAQNPTSNQWYVFANSCEVPTGWTNSKTEGVCAEVIIHGQSPKTGKWYPFATPCDIPAQWKSELIKPATDGTPQPGMCDGTVAYAKHLTTQNAYTFTNSCDVPEGEDWQRLLSKPAELKPDKVDCPPVIIYAQHPEKKTWYTFPTVCEVPEGWTKSATPPPVSEGEDCSSVKATYSPTDWKVHIPFIFLNNTDTQPAFEDAELELLSTQVTPYLFFVSKVKVSEKVPEKVEDSQP